VNSVVRVGIVAVVVLASGCSGGGGGGAEEALPGKQATYSVGGTLILNGAPTAQPISITVADSTANSGLTASLTAAGSFTFERQLAAGTRYELDVTASPGYGCQVRNGNRTMPGAAVNDIEVECTSSTFSLGGSVSGLGPVAGLRLTNGSDMLDVTGDGPFTLAPVTAGASYNVTLSAAGGFAYECNVANGSGSNVAADVSNIAVTCAMPIRATVSGLGGGTTGLTLNNGYGIPGGASASDSVTATSNVTYTFSQRLPYGSSYAMAAVMSGSSDYSCTVTNGSGTVGAAAINAAVACQLVPTMAVTSSAPLSGAIGVSRTTAPTINFSTLLDASTVTNSSVTLISQYGAETVVPSASGNQITVALDQPLRRATNYILDVSTAVRGSAPSRARLASPVAIGFSTSSERIWHTPVLLETNNTSNAGAPSIALDSSGNVFAVWGQSDGVRSNIWANRYTASSRTWGSPTVIESGTGNARGATVVVSANGDALAVWYQHDGTRENVWSNAYSLSSNSWGTPTLVETNNVGDARYPGVAISDNGDALAVWSQSDGVRNNLWSNRYTAATGTWGTAALIETDNGDIISSAQIAMNGNGDALAVWYQSDGTRDNIWANRYTATSRTWSTATLIETNNLSSAGYPLVAINENGYGVAAWSQSDGSRGLVWVNRYSPISRTWGTATAVSSASVGSAIGYPRVAISPSGDALAAWHQAEGAQTGVWSNRYAAANSAWGTAVSIDQNTTGSAAIPDIAMDADGNALAVWHRWDGTRYNVWSNRYMVSSNTWGTAAMIALGTGTGDPNPRIVMDSDGNAHAAWVQTDGTRLNGWSSRFE
jgi:hypothetical protein